MVPRTSSLHIGDLHFAVYVIGPRSREDRRRGSAAAIDRRAAAAGSGVIAGLGRCQRADRLHLEPGRGPSLQDEPTVAPTIADALAQIDTHVAQLRRALTNGRRAAPGRRRVGQAPSVALGRGRRFTALAAARSRDVCYPAASVLADGSAPEPPPQRGGRRLSPGDVVAGRYRIVRTLGRGSFGHTYLAVDTAASDREVAVKQLRTDGDSGWKGFELFEREAAALRSLRHHGIPEIFDHLRETAGDALSAYLVMEYIDGVSLEQRIVDGASLDPAALLRVALGLLDILEYLHARVPPVLHRDIKPANVLLRPDGAPALVDFGAVRTVFRGADEGGSTVVGTFGYMPIEQTMGQASPASDLYAVGATLLHLITRRPPSEFASRDGVIEVPFDLPGGAVLRGVIARLLAPTASARYQSAREVREALLAPVHGGAAPSGTIALARVQPTTSTLAPTPRALTGELRTRFDQVTLSPVRLLFADHPPSQPLSAAQRSLMVLLGLMSLGLAPLVFWIFYNARRTRARPFFLHGVPVSGRILQVQKTEWIQVTYEFVHAGATHRGVDTIIPAVAGRWQPGDVIELLVLPERNHDSIIITST
nr:serine/threonine-protein kinase [Nannocystis sp. RBIL2]